MSVVSALARDQKAPTGDLRASEAYAWQFPKRVAKHNVALALDEATMHLSAHARRIAILLANIGGGNRLGEARRRPKED